jgi:glyoxylase-like metal-dependent hydrolase (beta-lactamase superfamily II)
MIKNIIDDVYQLNFKNFGSCVYIIKKQENIMIDTSSKINAEELLEDLKKIKMDLRDINLILLTHSHYDHIENIELFPNARVFKKENLNELNEPEITVINTPGHTKDSVCFLYKNILFSGDTLFNNGIGRTDLPESVPNKMKESLDRLKQLKYEILCPGHID